MTNDIISDKEQQLIINLINESHRQMYNDYLISLPQDDEELLEENWSDEYRDSKWELYNLVEICDVEYNPDEYRIFTKQDYTDKWKELNKLNENVTNIYPLTQPSDVVIKNISETFYLKIECFRLIKRHKVDKIARHIVVNLPEWNIESSKTLKMYDEAFKDYGYFRMGKVAQRKCDSIFRYILQYEPYYYDKREYLPDFLYHMTTNESAEIIKKIGFKPSNQALKIIYPPRNYFFIYDNLKFMTAVMYNNKRVDYNSKGNIPVSVIVVDSNKSQCTYYSEPYYKKHCAVYTYDNVSAKSISEVIQRNI